MRDIFKLILAVAIFFTSIATIGLIYRWVPCPKNGAHPIRTVEEADRITITNSTDVTLNLAVQSTYADSGGSFSFGPREDAALLPLQSHTFLRQGSAGGSPPAGYSISAWTPSGKVLYDYVDPARPTNIPCSFHDNGPVILADAISAVVLIVFLVLVLKGWVPNRRTL